MKLAYVISFCLFLNSSYSQDLYTYEKIDSTLHAWQEMTTLRLSNCLTPRA